MSFFVVLNHWLHLISAVLWIGGIAFQVFISAPFLRRSHPAYIQDLAQRFRYIVSPLIFILVVTGGINFGVRRGNLEAMPTGYISALGTKVLLVAVVASLHFIAQVLPVSRANAIQEGPVEASSVPGLTLTKLTLAIGFIIIFLAAMLRHWRFS